MSGETPGVGATSLGWKGHGLPSVLDQLRELGGECLELNSRPGLHAGLVVDERTAPQVRGWAEDAGIRIESVAGYNDFSNPDPAALREEEARLFTACEMASRLGARIVRAFVADVHPGLDFESVRPHVIEAFRWVASRARGLGITLAMENHGRLVNDGAILASLVQEIGEDNVRITLDTGNFAWTGHDAEQVAADFDAVLPYVVSVHVKDGVWRDGSFEFVPAGEGELPLAELVRRLVARGFSGPIYSEYEGSGDFLEGTRTSIAFLKRCVRDATRTAT